MAERSLLIEHTADIVSAHVANNTVALADVPTLVQRVYEALSNLAEPKAEAEPEGKTPVVSARASVKPDFIVCMECGRKQKTLKRHLQTAHGMSPDQYRKDYGLPSSYPMVAPNYSKQRGELARQIGLGRKRGAQPAAAAPAPAKSAPAKSAPAKSTPAKSAPAAARSAPAAAKASPAAAQDAAAPKRRGRKPKAAAAAAPAPAAAAAPKRRGRKPKAAAAPAPAATPAAAPKRRGRKPKNAK